MVYGETDGKKVVQVEQGMLEGLVSVTEKGTRIATFTSIPYAKPPLGPLRFKAPQAPEKWEGVRPADAPFRVCTQMGQGEEDCLLLNVVAPLDKGDKLPVMFWIHGGAFFLGSASLEFYGFESFADRGMVMVSANYRLSALGFLSLEGSDVTPNAGLKDLVAALRWVRSNIAQFGGGPDHVTVFGESAGAASVQYLVVSPMARGLFKGAIMQSGTACANWAFREPSSEDAFRLGESLGKRTSDPQELAEFLRALPASDIVDKVLDDWASRKAEMKLKSINVQTIPFVPTVDYPVGVGDSLEEVFLPDRPDSLLKQGTFNKDLPQIIGMNSLEAAFLTSVPGMEEWPLLEANWESFVPEDMGLRAGSPASKLVAARVREFYFHNETLSDLSAMAYLECSSDADWTRRTSECTKYVAQHTPDRLWVYYFTYQGSNSITCNTQDCTHISGAAHFDEVLLLFPDNPLGGPLSPEDRAVQGPMLDAWTSFARTGRPDPGAGVTWTPVESPAVLSHLVFDGQPRMDPGDLRANYTSFWAEVGAEVARLGQ
ncbi:esterase E4-like isoform X2 [Bacillus rossius redtenbacheri]|uniref:esterase E4-like isoform X2 n=1 Tax=Bacillus rossius redtenbacheri TaxID=93214 RepID=UPI002FDD286F